MMDGLISVIKPPGITSHDVVSWARKLYQIRKIGHAGTLDPGAAGVLVLGIGKGTRLIPYVQEQRKTYIAEVSLGYTTESMDMFSPITARQNIPELSHLEWQQVLNTFLGDSKQLPPMTSAIKVNGQPLYSLARQGITIERESRLVTIYKCQLLSMPAPDKLMIEVECSSGTYIRTLCNDIGARANTLGCMSFLLRASIGSFTMKNSVLMSDQPKPLRPLVEAVSEWDKYTCSPDMLDDIKNGKQLKLQGYKVERLALLDEHGALIALANKQSGREYFHPYKVFL